MASFVSELCEANCIISLRRVPFKKLVYWYIFVATTNKFYAHKNKILCIAFLINSSTGEFELFASTGLIRKKQFNHELS